MIIVLRIPRFLSSMALTAADATAPDVDYYLAFFVSSAARLPPTPPPGVRVLSCW